MDSITDVYPQRRTGAGPCEGGLLGLAIGDAVGTTLEFLPRDRSHVHDMVGGGPFKLNPGEWTDDTSMALCLADTYLAKGNFDLIDYAERVGRWYINGENSHNGKCFDIGNATRTAIEERLKNGGLWYGNAAPSTAGNGSIIRLAPTAIFCRHSLSATWRDSAAQSQCTHRALEAISCCRLLGAQLHLALNGADKEETLSPMIRPLRPRALIINAGEYKEKTATRSALQAMSSTHSKQRFGLYGIPTISKTRSCWLPTWLMMPTAWPLPPDKSQARFMGCQACRRNGSRTSHGPSIFRGWPNSCSSVRRCTTLWTSLSAADRETRVLYLRSARDP